MHPRRGRVRDIRERVAIAIDRIPGLTRRTARLLLTLWDADGRLVTIATIADHLAECPADVPTDDAIRSAKKRLVRTLAAAGAPVAIEAVAGVGYRLRRLDPGWEVC